MLSHFYQKINRIYEGITMSDLLTARERQSKSHCRRIEYSQIAKVVVDEAEYMNICNDLSAPRECFRPYAHMSRTTKNGIFKCIVIESEMSTQQIILYTAGQAYPLYAAIRDSK